MEVEPGGVGVPNVEEEGAREEEVVKERRGRITLNRPVDGMYMQLMMSLNQNIFYRKSRIFEGV